MAIRSIRYKGKKWQLAYERAFVHQERTILFLHGWGSNKAIMRQAFGAHLSHYAHLYLDLPGFGKSDLYEALDTQAYAKIVTLFLSDLNITPEVVVGHSFGGKVATLLAPSKLVLLSSAGIVWPKSLVVQLKIALYKALKPIGGNRLYRYFASEDVAHMPPLMYATFKKVVDEDFRHIFGAYQGRALLCWGEEDRATPLKSGQEIATLMPHATLRTFQGDHYFFLHNPQPVIEAMEEFFERV